MSSLCRAPRLLGTTSDSASILSTGGRYAQDPGVSDGAHLSLRATVTRANSIQRLRPATQANVIGPAHAASSPDTLSGAVRGKSEPATTRSPRAEPRTDRRLVRKLFPRGPFGPKHPGHRTSPFAGSFVVGETGFEPATARPPASGMGCRSVDEARVRGCSAPECIPGALSLFPKFFPSAGLPDPLAHDETAQPSPGL